MRILWVKPGELWPLDTGGRLRSFHTLSELSRRHQVLLLTTHGPGDDPQELAARLPHCERVTSFLHHPPKQGSPWLLSALLRSWFSELPLDRVPALRAEACRLVECRQVELCVADFLTAVPNVPLPGPVPPVVLFEHNVEHVIWKRRLAGEHRMGAAHHGDRLWLLLNLEIWHRVFVEGEDAGAMLKAA